jgi:rRNA maturation RNase YbeY
MKLRCVNRKQEEKTINNKKLIFLSIIGMGINIEINNITESPIADGFFDSVAKATFAELKYTFLNPSADGKEVGISLALVTPEEIRKLNKEYENIGQIEKAAAIKLDEELFLGELILCYDDIKEYAQKEELDLENEFAKVVSHGILHLLGFEHGEKMFSIEQVVVDKLIK